MTSSLFKHSSIIFIGIMVANFFAYILQIYLGRALGPIDYGVFGSLMALLLILSVPINVIGNVITRFVSIFRANGFYGKINSFMFSSIKKLLSYGIIGFVLISLLSPFIASYLNIDSNLPIILVGLTVLFSLFVPIVRGILQGLQKFNALSLNINLESIIRLILAFILVGVLGFTSNGAILSYGLAYLFAFLLAFIPLKFLFGKEDKKIDIEEIYHYAYPVLISTIFLVVLINIPTIFVKHYFSSLEAGYWNATLTISRLVQYISIAFSGVMFATVSEKFAKGESTKKLLNESLLYVFVICSLVVIPLILFPEFVIQTLFGNEYIPGAYLLKWFSLVFLFYSINYLFVNYELALKRFRFIYYLGLFVLLEIILIFLLHQSLINIIYILFAVNLLFLLIQIFRIFIYLSKS